MEIAGTAALGLILALVGACLGVTGWLSFRSWPQTLHSRLDRAESDNANVRHEWEVAKLELATLIQGLEDLHDRVKRAKAGNRAVQQRIEMSEAVGGEEEDPRMELRRKAGLMPN